VRLVLTALAYGAGWTAVFALGNSWRTLGVAAFLGVVFTQLGFVAHDAGHQQVMRSRRANRILGMTVANGLIGLSFGWWVTKHNAHHAHPNQIDLDPDIADGLVVSPGEPTNGRPSLTGFLTRWQAELFFPLMLLRSAGLHVSGIQRLIRHRDRAAAFEALLIASHAALYLTLVFWALSPVKALAFIAVQQGVFSLYLGCSFAPNHKGMPVLDADTQMNFAQRQVVTARNVIGGRLTSFVLGGLNYQIEHHLFPTMPRANLSRAQGIIQAFCFDNALGYCEDSLIGSYRQAVRSLRTEVRPIGTISPTAFAARS
jgi:fatty acid desaturase